MTKKKSQKENRNTDTVMADVLYQKLGNDWYAFTEVEGECYYDRVDEDTVNQKVIEEGLDRFFGKDTGKAA